jgi:hypothetical protein
LLSCSRKSLLVLLLSSLAINQAQARRLNAPHTDEVGKTEAFYQKINETIRGESQAYSKRVDCIIRELKNQNVKARINQTSYGFVPVGDGSFEALFVDKSAFVADLQASLDSANFICTVIGCSVIILIVTLLLAVFSCVSCLSRRK